MKFISFISFHVYIYMYNKYCGIEVNSKKRVREGIYAHIYENREREKHTWRVDT